MRILFLIVAVLLGTVASAQEITAKLPIPEFARQETTIKNVKELYKSELDAAKTQEQRSTLAKKLLVDGITTKNDKVGRYVLLNMAQEMAAQEGDVYTATEAVKHLSIYYDVDEFELRADVSTKLAKVAKTSTEQAEAAHRLFELAEECVKFDRYELAKPLLETGTSLSRTSKEFGLAKKFVVRGKEVELISKEHEALRAAAEVLARDPKDKAANTKVGYFHSFLKRDWINGLYFLQLGEDGPLKKIALDEITAEPSNAKLIGDQWWEIAEGEVGIARQSMLVRAGMWYEIALPKLEGFSKATVETRLRKLAAEGKGEEEERISEVSPAIDLSKVNLSGHWKSLANEREFILKDDGKNITVEIKKGENVESFSGSLVREGNSVTSTQWEWVFTNDSSKKTRKGEMSGQITNPNRMVTKFTKWEWDAHGNTIRTFTGHSVWVRKSK